MVHCLSLFFKMHLQRDLNRALNVSIDGTIGLKSRVRLDVTSSGILKQLWWYVLHQTLRTRPDGLAIDKRVSDSTQPACDSGLGGGSIHIQTTIKKGELATTWVRATMMTDMETRSVMGGLNAVDKKDKETTMPFTYSPQLGSMHRISSLFRTYMMNLEQRPRFIK